MRISWLVGIVWMLGLVVACQSEATTNAPTPHPHSAVTYPAQYRTDFVHYLTVDRIDGTIRDIYISPAALDAARRNVALPDETVIVIEAYHIQVDADGEPLVDEQGHYLKADPFEMVHVIEKRADWQDSDFVSTARVGEWNFGSFDAQTGDYFDEDTAACFHCHNPMFNTDFVYTYPQLATYAATKEVQHLYCDLANRLPC
ncbi:MAG: cytochrome P460 family protein [Anaerolineales bacterium]|nr:cytochrome P460 family protein [Anaerolineales bacterium]